MVQVKMARAWPWLLAAVIERGGIEVAFKAELIGLAERMDIGGEGKGKFVALSLWVSGRRNVQWEKNRIGGWGGNEEVYFSPIDFEIPWSISKYTKWSCQSGDSCWGLRKKPELVKQHFGCLFFKWGWHMVIGRCLILPGGTAYTQPLPHLHSAPYESWAV